MMLNIFSFAYLATCISCLKKCPFRSLFHFLIKLSFYYWLVRVPHLIWIINYCKYFLILWILLFHGVIFSAFKISMYLTDILLTVELFFSSFTYAFTVVSETILNPRTWRFTSMFYAKSFIVLVLIFRSTIHFELSFVYGVRLGSNFILLHFDI